MVDMCSIYTDGENAKEISTWLNVVVFVIELCDECISNDSSGSNCTLWPLLLVEPDSVAAASAATSAAASAV